MQSKKIISPLKSINVPVAAILDIDILNDETTFQELVNSFKIEIDDVLSIQKKIIESVEGMERSEVFSNLKSELKQLNQNLDSDFLNHG